MMREKILKNVFYLYTYDNDHIIITSRQRKAELFHQILSTRNDALKSWQIIIIKKNMFFSYCNMADLPGRYVAETKIEPERTDGQLCGNIRFIAVSSHKEISGQAK